MSGVDAMRPADRACVQVAADLAVAGCPIEVTDLRHTFSTASPPVAALGPVSFSVEAGEFVAIVGRSGCGKSTLLNILGGLITPSGGTTKIADDNADAGGLPAVGYMTQHDGLLPWRTVLANVAFPLELHKVGRRERLDRAGAVLHQVGLTGFEDRYPAMLSGGMRQRVNLARSLVYQPRVLLMDEPFGALDIETRSALHRLLLSTWSARRPTIVFVTHDIGEAVSLADRVITLSQRPGRIAGNYPITSPRPRAFAVPHGDSGIATAYQAIRRDLGEVQ